MVRVGLPPHHPLPSGPAAYSPSTEDPFFDQWPARQPPLRHRRLRRRVARGG